MFLDKKIKIMKDNSILWIIAAVAAYWYFNKTNSTPISSVNTTGATVTEPVLTATPLPFTTTTPQTTGMTQVVPTPASVLSPQQLQQYNLTGNSILSNPLKNANSYCNTVATSVSGISGKIYTC